MVSRIHHLLVGPPLPIRQAAHKRLNKIQALASFSPDALSSIAYANQEIYLGLLVAGSAGLALAWPIGLAITGLLILVAMSCFTTIAGYPCVPGSGTHPIRDECWFVTGILQCAVEPHLAFHVRTGAS